MPGRLLQYQDVDSDLEIEADVVIVGSGAGGATMASELSEGGLRVVILEEGGYHPTREINSNAADMIQKFYRDAGTAVITGKPNIIFAEGRCVGGSTVINGGMCWRTPEPVLKRWYLELGLKGFHPREVRRHFEKVEGRINVTTQHPETVSRHDRALKRGADRLGYKVTWNTRNQEHCVGTNNCAFGCPSGGKQSMLVSYLPRALSNGATLLSDTRVEQVIRDGDRVQGVVGYMRPQKGEGPTYKVTARAPLTVLACGATQTPVLLQKLGLCNSSGQVGRNFTCHPNAKVVAIMDEDIYGWKGVHQALQIREFFEEGLLFAAVFVPPSLLSMSMPFIGDAMMDFMENLNRMVVAGVLAEDATIGTIKPGPMGMTYMRYDLDPVTFDRVVRGTALTCEMLFEAGAKRIYLPIHGLPVIHSADEIHKIYAYHPKPTDFELMTVHAMSTCRMSADPNRGVVDAYGRAHDLRGLHIADASTIPTPVGLNPQETVMMLSTHQAEYVLNNWAKARRQAS